MRRTTGWPLGGVFSVIFASPSRSAPKHHNEVVLESALGSFLHSKFQAQSTDCEVMLESPKHLPDEAELAWGRFRYLLVR
jgi:hypothetical protein